MCRILSFSLLLIYFLLGSGCQHDSMPKLEPLDLIGRGISIKINAPTDPEIKISDMGILKDVTVQDSASGYNLQIFESETSTLNAGSIVEKLKKEIEDSAFFEEIISADEQGFIYKKVIDEDYINYDFRHVKVRGDRQYVFQAGLTQQYTLDEIKWMYNAVL